ncbi:hypothetical protein M1145_00065 [Patescibacteria group bacterium]|nr:hypothetical protein [Patescibacteria group bacterium]
MIKNKYTITIIDQGNTLMKIVSIIKRLGFKIEYMEIKKQDQYISTITLTLNKSQNTNLFQKSITNIVGVINLEIKISVG